MKFLIDLTLGGYQSSEYDRLCGAARMSNLFSPEKTMINGLFRKLFADRYDNSAVLIFLLRIGY